MLRGRWKQGIGFVGTWLLATAAAASPTTWLWVSQPGNPADTATGRGSVAAAYRIAATEVTNSEYTAFLDAVADEDPHDLYTLEMGSDATNGGIERSGATGSYDYSVKAGFAEKPVTYVSFWDALRYVNWLENGMTSGGTESGAYTLTQSAIDANSVARNAGAAFFLPSEDEWYKAAYYDPSDPGAPGYFSYPAASSGQTSCSGPGSVSNTANCFYWTTPSAVTDVGSYSGAASPFGTFDQGGNVGEWVESIGSSGGGSGNARGVRGGDFDHNALELWSGYVETQLPGQNSVQTGFRVARAVPEPGTALLLALGLAGCGARRQRSQPR